MKQFCTNLFSEYNKTFSQEYKLNYDFIDKLIDLKFDEMS